MNKPQTNLKTLKDLKHKGFFCQANLLDKNPELSMEMGVSIDELRAEIIKWIKALTKWNHEENQTKLPKELRYFNNKQLSMEEYANSVISAAFTLKIFFNITEEDLQEADET